MSDFEVLSRDAAESVAPVEPKRDAETPVESETVRRVRVGLDALTTELAEAKEAVAYLQTRENELLAEKAELARSLAYSKKAIDALTQSNNWFKADIERFADEDAKLKRELRSEIAAAQRLAERFQTALDAALNDVAIYRRAALWFGVSSVLAGVVALVAAAF